MRRRLMHFMMAALLMIVTSLANVPLHAEAALPQGPDISLAYEMPSEDFGLELPDGGSSNVYPITSVCGHTTGKGTIYTLINCLTTANNGADQDYAVAWLCSDWYNLPSTITLDLTVRNEYGATVTLDPYLGLSGCTSGLYYIFRIL